MSDELLYHQSEALILLILIALLFVGAEVGYRLGRRQSSLGEPAKSQLSSIQSAILALLGFLLGFTVAMSISRLDARKHAIVQEANAIGTAALRGRLLPAAEKTEAIHALRRYVDLRLQSSAAHFDSSARSALDRQLAELHERLWLLVAAVAKKEPQNFTTGLFIGAINDLIDAKGTRDAALDNHVPESVLFLLFIAATIAVGMVGYLNGIAAHRAWVVTELLIGLFALSIFVIIDLDRPGRGLINVSQKNMIDLKNSLEKTP
jgi:uncharacterized membrane protein (Fun14 family)